MRDYLAVIQKVAPSNWTCLPNDYGDKTYLTAVLENSSTEYEDIVNLLRDKHDSLAEGIRCIQRIQHPFAYGRFLLRKIDFDKREKKKHVPMRYVVQVKESQIEEALKSNLDERKIPFDCSYERTDSDMCAVVVQSLRPPQDWEVLAESYPDYVVFYNGIGQ